MNVVTLLLTALPGIMSSIETLTEFFHKSVQTLQQATELTPEQETQRDAIVAEAMAKDYWQQD